MQGCEGQAHAGSDDNTIVVRRRQMMLHCGSGGLVRAEKNRVGLPSAFGELLERNRDAGVNLFGGHAWRQRRVRKIHSLGYKAQEQNPLRVFSIASQKYRKPSRHKHPAPGNLWRVTACLSPGKFLPRSLFAARATGRLSKDSWNVSESCYVSNVHIRGRGRDATSGWVRRFQ
jgi:hypothetical protein